MLYNSSTPATGSNAPPGQTPPPRPPAPEGGRQIKLIGDTAAAVTGAAGSIARPRALSACAEHRELIEAQLRLGRNAVSIYQDSVAAHGFAHGYNSVERFVARLAGIPLCIFGPFQQRQPTSLLIADAPFRAA